MIDESTRSDIPLAGGGVMWVEPTRALTAIDLDSGSGDLAALFNAAPQAIARQLRLRQTGGLVAVDVPRASPAAGRGFDEALEHALARDPRSPERIGHSRGGMTEIRIAHGRPGPAMWAADRVAVDALVALRAISLRPQLASPRLECRLTPPTGSAGRAPLPWRRLTGRSSLLFRPMLDQPPSSRPQDDDIRQAGRYREDRRRRSCLSNLRRTGSSAG